MRWVIVSTLAFLAACDPPKPPAKSDRWYCAVEMNLKSIPNPDDRKAATFFIREFGKKDTSVVITSPEADEEIIVVEGYGTACRQFALSFLNSREAMFKELSIRKL